MEPENGTEVVNRIEDLDTARQLMEAKAKVYDLHVLIARAQAEIKQVNELIGRLTK